MCIIKRNYELLEQPARLGLRDIPVLPHFLVQVPPCHILHGNAEVRRGQEHLLQTHNEGMPAQKQKEQIYFWRPPQSKKACTEAKARALLLEATTMNGCLFGNESNSFTSGGHHNEGMPVREKKATALLLKAKSDSPGGKWRS